MRIDCNFGRLIALDKVKPSELEMKLPSAEIEAELQKYKKKVEAKCATCGYDGLMGVGEKAVKWYIRWPVTILIIFIAAIIWQFMLGGGILALVVVSFIMSSIFPRLFKNFIYCPQCKKRLKLKKV